MTPETLAAKALAWLGIPEDRPGPDTDLAPEVAAAVHAWVATLPATGRLAAADGSWSPSTATGAVMLTARLIRRRNTPSGIETFAADSATYVARNDPDVATLLRLGHHAYPAIG